VRLAQLNLTLPAPTYAPADLHLPFVPVNRRRDRILISGHPQTGPDGKIIGPYGQVGRDLTTDEAYFAAQGIGLSVLANLKHEIGELSRVTGWLRVFGMVNSAPNYSDQHLALNGFSDLILSVFGPDVGRHARSAIGTHGLPLNFAIEVEAEVQISPT
jgi:hypothetical protein